MNESTSTAKRPLWRQIHDSLRTEVLEGALAPGQRLPTEHELAQRFGVNRHTVRRAVSALADAGLVRVEQGRGMFVQENVLFYPIGRRTRFTESVEKQNRSRGRRILSVDVKKADARVAHALGMLRGRAVIRLRALQEVDGRPVSLSEDFFNRTRFPKINEYAIQTQSITESLRLCGVADYFRKRTGVTTRLPKREEAEVLRQPHNRPILVTENLDVDDAGKPVSFGFTLWSGDRVQLVFDG